MDDPTTQETGWAATPVRWRHLLHVGAFAGAAAAVSTTVVAATASAADVRLEINAEAIPIVAFAWWTLIGAAVGVGLARFLGERRRFVVVATILAVLSLIPAITAPDRTATKVVLVGAQFLAAAVIIPAVSQGLTPRRHAKLHDGVNRC